MIRSIGFLLVAALLNSCGVIRGFEDRMDHLNDEVTSTNHKLDDTKDGQALGAALTIMIDEKASPNIRATAAKTVFLLAKEEKIFEYIGAPGPLERASVPIPIAPMKMPSIPNVAYYGDAASRELSFAPINSDLHLIQIIAATNLVKQISVESKTPNISEARLNYLRTIFPRVRNVATAILGGMPLSSLPTILQGKKRNFGELTEEERRERILVGTLLRDIGASLNFPQADIDQLNQMIDARLGAW